MRGLDNTTYISFLLISNLFALLLLFSAWKYPRLSRLLFFLLFTWAGWMNWRTLLNDPNSYLDYSNLAMLNIYERFIKGWFKDHIALTVGFIATCQLLIAIGIQSKGMLFKIAAVAALIFLLAIIPLGVGSGFPCTLIMAVAMYFLLQRSPANYLWIKEQKPSLQ